MVLVVKWNKRAESKFEKILKYLIEEFGNSIAKRFYDKTFQIIEILSDFPEL